MALKGHDFSHRHAEAKRSTFYARSLRRIGRSQQSLVKWRICNSRSLAALESWERAKKLDWKQETDYDYAS
jgi:hypothetical protein